MYLSLPGRCVLTHPWENGEKVFAGFEDPRDETNIVKTPKFDSISPKLDPRLDYSPNGHGTRVASKIVGRWGIAQGVTLVPVQIHRNTDGDLAQGMNAAWRDFMFHR